MWGYLLAGAGLLLGLPAAALVAFIVWIAAEGAKHKPKAPLFPGPPDGTGRSLFSKYREDAFVYLAQLWGKTFTLDTVVATCDPALVRTLLLSQKHSLGRSWLYRLFAKLMPYSDGILFMEDEAWRLRHKEFIPLFAGPNIRLYTLASFKAAVEVAEANRTDGGAAAVPRRVDGLLPIGVPAAPALLGADLLQAVRAVAVRFLLGWGAGMDADAPASIRLGAALDDYAHTCLEVLPYASSPPVLGHLAQYARLWGIALSLRRQCDALVVARAYESKDARNAAAAAGVPAPVAPPPNFVGRMVAAGFSPRDIASEVNHVHGAHKAVAFTTTAALFELSTPGHGQAWRAKVRAELEAAFGKPAPGASAAELVAQAAAALPPALREAVDAGLATLPPAAAASSGAPASTTTTTTTEGAEASGAGAVPLPRPADLPLGWRPPERLDAAAMETALPATWCVWQETLRRHVVSMGSMRRTGEPVTHEGVTIPPNTDVNILLHALHHLPEHWGPRANEFRPERWERRGERGSAELGPLADHVYFPFLDGVRRCAGMHVAGMQFVIMLYVFLVIYDVQVVVPEGSPPPAAAGVARASAAAAPSPGPDAKRAEALAAGLVEYPPSTFATHAESAVVPDGAGGWKLRMRPEMFSAFDGRVPFTCVRR